MAWLITVISPSSRRRSTAWKMRRISARSPSRPASCARSTPVSSRTKLREGRMLRLTVARDSKAVADAKQVRWQVYREEEGMLPADAAGGELQVEALHAERRLTDLVVYSGVEP